MPDSYTILIQPRDPLIARDARPFSAADAGGRARSLEWPFPQTIAGAMRTHIGTVLDWTWGAAQQEQAAAIAVQGPILVARRESSDPWTPYLPAPRDALVSREDVGGPYKCLRLRPGGLTADGAGTDLPAGLSPLTVPADVKPTGDMAYWPLSHQVAWARDPNLEALPEPYLATMPRETRVHVSIDHQRGAGIEGMLFSTEGLAFASEPMPGPANGALSRRDRSEPSRAMLCRVLDAPTDWTPRDALIALGGERRAAAIAPGPPWPDAPEDLLLACSGARRLRLQLATPAHFAAGGWRPDWIDADSLSGSPPDCPGLTLRLISAAVGRPLPVSGWDFARRGPKPVRRLVPAGSVYYFEVASGELSRSVIAGLWLASICTGEPDRRDGYGLVIPGIW